MITLWWSEVTGRYHGLVHAREAGKARRLGKTDHQFLEDDAGIDHAELQRVITGGIHVQGGVHFANAVADGFFPGVLRVIGKRVDDLEGLIIEGDRVTQAATGNEIVGRREDGLDGGRTAVEEKHAVFECRRGRWR